MHCESRPSRNPKKPSALFWAAAILFLAFFAAVSAGAQEFKRIFDGATLTGWHKTGNANWTIADSALVGTATAAGALESYLISDRTAKDFGLRLKFQWTVGNSGVNFRNLEKNGIATGIQVDLDGTTFGNLYDNVKAAYVATAKPDSVKKWFKPNAWNDLTIEAKGTRIIVTLNGKQTVDFQDAGGRAEGVFAFQMHVGQTMSLKFKDIELRDDSQVSALARPRDGAARSAYSMGGQSGMGASGSRWFGSPGILTLDMLRGRTGTAPRGNGSTPSPMPEGLRRIPE